MSDIAIKVGGVYKSFSLPHERHGSIKNLFVSGFKRKRTYEKQEVLQDISFDIKKGEFFGIVGRNGSGKSTLLKLMAGIYSPDKGGIHINGKLTPFIELGVGFNPELTGRENVFLNGALLGFDRKKMEGLYDEIVEFAELEKFMDQKLKNYSSGMQVRLAFSIAIQVNTDILILDEVLAVGDSNFQRKCYDYFEKLKRENKTVVLVTHDMDSVERFCSKAMVIDKGKMVAFGSPQKVTKKYSDLNLALNEQKIGKNQKKEKGLNSQKSSAKVSVSCYSDGIKKVAFKPQDRAITFEVKISSKQTVDSSVLGIIVKNSGGLPVFATNTKVNKITIPTIDPAHPTNLNLEVDNIFSNGEYRVSVGLKSPDGTTIYFSQDDAARFIVGGRKHYYAVASPRYSISMASK